MSVNTKIEIGWDAIFAAVTAVGTGLVLMWGQVSDNSSDIENQDRYLQNMREDVIYIRDRVDEIAQRGDPDG